jgi:hypothetical protein
MRRLIPRLLAVAPVIALNNKFEDNVLKNDVYRNTVRKFYMDRLTPQYLNGYKYVYGQKPIVYKSSAYHNNKCEKLGHDLHLYLAKSKDPNVVEKDQFGQCKLDFQTKYLSKIHRYVSTNMLAEMALHDIQAIKEENAERIELIKTHKKMYDQYSQSVRDTLKLDWDFENTLSTYQEYQTKLDEAYNKKKQDNETTGAALHALQQQLNKKQ